MKLKIYHLLVAFAVVFALSACSEDNYEIPEITLDKSELNFSSEGGQDVVQIETNADDEDWSAFSPKEGEWVSLSQKGTKLEVNVSPNELGVDRSTIVVVSALGAEKKIKINQSEGKTFINLSVVEELMNTDGGVLRVDFATNAGKLDIQVRDAEKFEWISADYVDGLSYFDISVDVNEEYKTREAYIDIIAGQNREEVKIVQAGKDLYIFPLLSTKSTIYDFTKFEQKKGNILVHCPDQVVSDMFGSRRFVFATGNPIFPALNYDCSLGLPMYEEASILSLFPQVIFQDVEKHNLTLRKEFEQAAEDAGFDMSTKCVVGNTTTIQGNPKTPFKMTIIYEETMLPTNMETIKSVFIKFVYSPYQTEDYETYNELPMYDKAQFLSFRDLGEEKGHGTKVNAVVEMEKQAGYLFIEEKSVLPYFGLFAVPEELQEPNHDIMRIYLGWRPGANVPDNDPFIGELAELNYAFNKTDMMFWKSGNKYFITREYDKLLADNGFVFFNETPEGMVSYRNDENLYIFMQVGHYDDLGDIIDAHMAYFDMSKKKSATLKFVDLGGYKIPVRIEDKTEISKKISEIAAESRWSNFESRTN